MRQILSFIFICCTCAVLAQAPTTNAGKSLSKAHADSTLQQLHEALVKYHPFAHRGRGKEQLDSVAAEIGATLEVSVSDSILLGDFIGMVSPFSRLIGDGHLHLRITPGKKSASFARQYNYGISAARLSDSRYVLTDSLVLADSTILPPATELISFAGTDMAQLVPLLGSFFGLNDHDNRIASEYFISRNIASLFQSTYGYRDSFEIEIFENGSRKSAWIKPNPSQKTPKPTKEQKRKDLLFLDTVSLADVYKLDIRTFSSSRLKKVPEYRLIRRYFNELNEKNAKGLVIDLRNNTGGSMNMVLEVYKYLSDERFMMVDEVIAYDERAGGKNMLTKFTNYVFGGIRKKEGVYRMREANKTIKPKKTPKRFDGEVVVLVNEPTFSGGSTLATFIQDSQRGKVVGQVTGGSSERMYAAIIFKEFIGPNDELVINMPLWYMDMTGNATGNVVPDVLVPRTADDYLSEKDVSLEKALQLMQEAISN